MIKKKKNIAILVPKLSYGGSERVVSNISLNLSDNYNQHIIVYYNDRIDYDYNGKIINLELKSSDNLISKIINFIKRLMKIKKLKKDYNIQSTLSLLNNPNLINILSRKKDKILISFHYFKSNEVKNIYDKLHDYLIRYLYNRADHIITVSELIRQNLIKNCKLNCDKVITIYNGHDIKLISKLSKEKLEDEYKNIFKYPVIINVGSLLFPKGQWHLIKSFKLIKKEIQDAKLVFIGQETLKNDFIKLAKFLNLEKDIYFIGFQNNPFKFINKSKIFALSSLHEAFPNVLVEALACSTAIVSTDCKSGPRELLSPKSNIFDESKNIDYAEYGVLTPPFEISYSFKKEDIISSNETLFAKAIINLLKNDTLREKYENNAYQRALDFDINKTIKHYEKILK